MKVIGLLLLLVCVSCKKPEHRPLIPGVWVEKSLRLDTIDFNDNRLSSEQFTALNFRSDPAQNSSVYHYYFKKDSILLRSLFSSSLSFKPGYFQMSGNKNSFVISRFYLRNSLPEIIEFERIQ